MISSIIWGFVLGFFGLGLHSLRTSYMVDGRVVATFISSSGTSICLFIYTLMVIEKDIPFVVANTIGASIAVSMVAYRRRKSGANNSKDLCESNSSCK